MYLLKQWRESRILSAIAALVLVFLAWSFIKASIKMGPDPFAGNGRDEFAGTFVALYYVGAIFLAFWAWLIASIGIGKNLGEDSGSFLFTRPRSRAWFLWHDWAFGMAQIALIALLSVLMMGIFSEHILTLGHSPGAVRFTAQGDPISLIPLLLLISIGILLFTGLVFSLTYFSTIVLKRMRGVLLGAGILFGYVSLSAIIHHYYPSIHLPGLIPPLFDLSEHQIALSDHLGLSLAIRAAVMMLFPISAQLVLDRAEI